MLSCSPHSMDNFLCALIVSPLRDLRFTTSSHDTSCLIDTSFQYTAHHLLADTTPRFLFLLVASRSIRPHPMHRPLRRLLPPCILFQNNDAGRRSACTLAVPLPLSPHIYPFTFPHIRAASACDLRRRPVFNTKLLRAACCMPWTLVTVCSERTLCGHAPIRSKMHLQPAKQVVPLRKHHWQQHCEAFETRVQPRYHTRG